MWRTLNFIKKTLAPTGATSVKIKTNTNDKESFTVTLIISAGGLSCKPIITVKGKTPRSLNKMDIKDDEIIATVSNKGWTSENILELALEQIYDITKGSKAVLLLDKFPLHETVNFINSAYDKNIKLIYIPSGMTYKYQPLDVSINGIIKETGIVKWKEDRCNNPDKLITIADGLKHFIDSWKMITIEQIKKSFVKAEIFKSYEI
jgi:hypothetical protein